MLRLFLLRHGETDYNLNKIIQGGGVDSDLNDTGRMQGAQFHNRYSSIPFTRIYASAQKRSYQTIEGFEKSHSYIIRLPELNEMNWGILEGKKASPEMHQQYLSINESWDKGMINKRMEEGESPQECWDRLSVAINHLKQDQVSGNVLICTHGRVLRILLAELLGYGMQCMNFFPHSNTGLNVLDLRGNGKWVAEKLNDLDHLK